MATWTAPIDTETDPDAPLLSSLGKRWDNNVIAAFEGGVGAPHSAAAWHPYDGVTVGDGNDGLIYDFAVDGAVGLIETPFFDDGYEYRIIAIDVSASLTGTWVFYLYLETSALLDDAVTSSSVSGSGVVTFDFRVHFPRRIGKSHVVGGELFAGGAGELSDTLTGGVYNSTPQKIRYARIQSAGNIDAGKIYMHRRKVEDGT